ncbi:glycoside hydrolase family 36 protein [Annulohypoxylon maeteangense]|uniref:glycoside hydrolase family 36 protein n=1 Tax=Annulohypoxylon maeteangense TaxID=1927788 RepID=UPI002007C3B6|nr:glycoside hydrolase family 36 protein [Annulohypoxylon maeteangense]KAI0882239.1 glycoside hydrolase family 36 protein [Annulohypoxylon maeteangense]
MAVNLSSYPPLGQVTQLKDEDFQFTVLLEVDNDLADDPWEVAVWHSSTDGDWTETSLSPTPTGHSPVSLQPIKLPSTQLCFSAPFSITSLMKFTLKFRNGHNRPWIWPSERLDAISDGVVLINPANAISAKSTDLSNIINGLNPELRVNTAASQTLNTQLWTLQASVSSSNDSSAYADVNIGIPWGGALRYFALVRQSASWLTPRHGSDPFSIEKDAVMCSFLSNSGRHLVLLGVSGPDNVITLLRSSDAGSVKMHIRNDEESESSGLVLAAVGDDFESTMAAVMYHARTVIFAAGNSQNELTKELEGLNLDIEPQWYENWYDGLGYCTWNALGQDLTEEKIINAVQALAKDQINISSLIIDDNWQDIDYRGQEDDHYEHGWKGFEAKPKAFPNGLKDTVSRIRSSHPTIENIIVWHALLGYWGGISPDGGLAKSYKTVQVDRKDFKREGTMTVIAKEDVAKFYDDFYRFLSNCGVDGVKTDVQSMIDTWVNSKPRRELTETYLDSWMISILRHFGLRAISCMSQAPQLLFRQQLPRNRSPLIVRNSDDFFPDIGFSHPWHIFANAHITLLTQHLNVLPDWDMFQTDHKTGGFHAAARCLSGGPIYITDIPGKHDIDLINQMTGKTPRGKTVIFRPSVLGKSIDPYTSYHEPVVLKIGSFHGRAGTGTPMLGVFNISFRPLREIIALTNFPGIDPSLEYVVRTHRSGFVTPTLKPNRPTADFGISLDVREYDILTAFPVTQFNSETNGKIYIANLGLVGKMTGAAAITSYQFELHHTDKAFLDTRLKALGVLGLYISSLPDMSIERDFMATIQGEPIPPHTVTINADSDRVLNIDIEKAWKEMGLEAGWANEVEVKVYLDIEYP